MQEHPTEYQPDPILVVLQNETGPNQIGEEELGRSFYLMGKLQYDKADFFAAENSYRKSLDLRGDPRDVFSSLKTLGFLVRIAAERQDEIRAREYIERAEKLVDQMTSILGSLNAEYFYNVGILHNYKGDFKAERDNYLLCYKKAEEENEPELLAKCLLALAINASVAKDFQLSLDYLGKLDQLLRIIDKSYLRGSMYVYYGKVYLELGQYEQAIEYFTKANLHLQAKKCWNLFGYILYWKGKVYKRWGDFNRSLMLFELAIESIDVNSFRRLKNLIEREISDVNDNSVDIYLDRANRKIKEKYLGEIDFKHRFILLEILFLLAKNSGNYYNKDQLAKLIWKDEYNPLIHDKLIYTSVSRLRKLIEPKNDRGSKRKYIVRGKDGYTFNPLVKIRFQIENKQAIEQTLGNVELSAPV